MHGLIEKYLKEYLETNEGKTLSEPEADAFFETEMEVDTNVDAETEADASFEQEMEANASFATDMEVDASVDDSETEVNASMEPETEADASSDKVEKSVATETEVTTDQESKGFDEKSDENSVKEKAGEFKCEYCSSEFTHEDQLKKHLGKEHFGITPLECDSCNANFFDKNVLKHHMTNVHGISSVHEKRNLYNCDICNLGFNQVEEMRTHVSSVHERKKYTLQCSLCDKIFTDQKTLKTHCIAVHGEEKPFKCTVCTKKFSFEKNLKLHIVHHDRNKQQKCDKCNETLPNLEKLREHMVKVHFFDCNQCKFMQIFPSKEALKTHIENVHEGKNHPFQCGRCERSFELQTDLNKHILEFHKGTLNLGNGIQLSSLKEKNNEIQKQSNEKAKIFPCTTCDSEFSSKDTLEDHFNSNHKVREKCPLCNKSFATSSKLKDHLEETHDQFKTGLYLCKECPEKFKHQKDFERHKMEVHDGTKSNKENTEPRKSWSRKLKKENKRFECQVCQKSFAHKPSLLRHIKTVHEGKNPNFCELCNKDFGYKTDLDTHNKLYHKDSHKRTKTEVETETEVDASKETEMKADASDKPETDVRNVSPPTDQKKNHIPLEFTFDDL